VPHAGEVVGLESSELGHEPVLGRGLADDVDAQLLDHPEPLGGVECALVEDDRRAAAPRAEEDVPERLRPPRARRAPDEVARAAVDPLSSLVALCPGVAVGLHDALRILRRSRGVDDQRGILGTGLGRRRVGLAELGLVEVALSLR
jgi:hypothetical protein